MGTFLSIIIIFISILLGIVVLIQNPKGGGLATGFTGVGSIGGVKRTTDFLEKATWGLAIAIFVLCLFSTSQLNNQGGFIDNSGDEPTELNIDTSAPIDIPVDVPTE